MNNCTICEQGFEESQTTVICPGCESAITQLIGPKGRRKKFTLAQWTIAGAIFRSAEPKVSRLTKGVGKVCDWVYSHDVRGKK